MEKQKARPYAGFFLLGSIRACAGRAKTKNQFQHAAPGWLSGRTEPVISI